MCETYEEALYYADYLSETVSCKKAAIVVVFFLYILDAGITGLIYAMEFKKKDEKVIAAMKGFKADIEQRSFFFLCFALLIQILTPVPVGVVLLYIYLLTFPLLFIGHYKPDKWKLRLIGIGIQFLIMFIIILWVLINPWCRYYYYRYVVGVPPDNYYSSIASTIDRSTTQQPSTPTPTPTPSPPPAPPQQQNNSSSTNTTTSTNSTTSSNSTAGNSTAGSNSTATNTTLRLLWGGML